MCVLFSRRWTCDCRWSVTHRLWRKILLVASGALMWTAAQRRRRWKTNDQVMKTPIIQLSFIKTSISVNVSPVRRSGDLCKSQRVFECVCLMWHHVKGYLAARSPRSLKSINIYQRQFTAAAFPLVSIDELINCHSVNGAVKGRLCAVSLSTPSEEDT